MNRKGFQAALIALVISTMPVMVNAQQLTRADLPRLAKKALDRHRVIVRLKESNTFTPKWKAETPADKRAHLRTRRDAKISELESKFAERTTSSIRTINSSSSMSMRVSELELAQLLDDSDVEVFSDRWNRPMLLSSTPIVFERENSDFDGSGWAVAILDTGVDKAHLFLSGRVIEAAEACFSNGGVDGEDVGGLGSLCPGQAGQSIGSGSGVHCALTDCDHGTKMAGIIAGSDEIQAGVATGAQLISVQIYSKSNSEVDCGGALNTPCIGALNSDIERGLNHVHSLRDTYQIASVNLSFGFLLPDDGGAGPCDNEGGDGPTPIAAAINNLKSANIAVVAATGNDGQTNNTATPACISGAIAVAATDDNDNPSWANNRSGNLDLFAPGEAVETSVPDGVFAFDSGTSIATAFVSGAWAVLREKEPNMSVDQLLAILKSQGPLITQNPFSRHRLDVDGALAALSIAPDDGDDFCFPIKASNGNVVLICL